MTTTHAKNKAKHVWSLRLIGDPALISPSGVEQPLERRAAALLALVALEPGISRGHVAALLWPDSDPANARQALRQQLLRLKKAAGREIALGHASLHLSPDVQTDLAQEGAHGAFLGRFEYAEEEELGHWVDTQRESLRGNALEHLRQELAHAENAGETDIAVRIAERLVTLDMDNERNHRALMRAHYLAGDVSRAQLSYDRLRTMLGREFAAKPSAETEQLASTIRAAREAPLPGAPRVPPPSVLRPPRLIGRAREWEALEETWFTAGCAIVSGPAGLGKTRLLGDFSASRAGIAMIAARPGDALVAYSLLARIVRRLVSKLRAPPEPGVRSQLARLLPELGEAEPVRDKAGAAHMLQAVDLLLERSREEGLARVVVDDLHHADAASLEALQALVSSEHRLPCIVSGRCDEIGREAQQLIDALISIGGRRIELQPLTPLQVQELLASLELPGFDAERFAPQIAKHTAGNPLFILETVKAMLLERKSGGVRLPVAESVAQLIRRRLERLSEAARRVARCAAIAGQDFSIELASCVLGKHALDLVDAWSELESVQVFTGGAFVHDLVHEATLATVPQAIARRLHGQIAACLESSGADPGRTAVHWETAGEPRKAGAAFTAAATQARLAGRRMEEADLLARAAACFGAKEDTEAAFEARLARAEAMVYGDLGEATLASVLAAESAARDDTQRLRALLCKAEFLNMRSDSQAAVETGRIGIKLAKRAHREDLAARFALAVAGGLCDLRRVDEALALLEPLRAWTDANLAPRSRVEFLVQLGITLDLANRLGDALAAFDAARAIALAEGFKDLLATALSNLATTTSKRGKLGRAVEYGRQAVQLYRESELLKGTPMQTQTLLAHRLRDIGHYDEAIAMLEEALAEFRRAGTRHWIFSAAHRLALAYAYVGQHARALHLLAEEPEGIALKAQAIWLAHRAECARLAGADAATPIRAALALLGGDVDDGNNRFVSLIAAGIVPPSDGEKMAADVAAWAQSRERCGMAVAAHIRAAACALSLGALDRAGAHVEAALGPFPEFEPDNLYRAEVWWVAGQVLQARGDRAAAQRLLAEGANWVRRTCEQHVPPPFHSGFLRRNAVNRALRDAAPAGRSLKS